MTINLPNVRGTLTRDKDLDGLTWLRVGGPADVLFQPADVEDLAAFLAELPADVPVFPMGVGSNLIVRDAPEQGDHRPAGCGCSNSGGDIADDWG